MWWHTYEYGFKTKAAAQAELDNEVSEGRLTAADCKVSFYRNTEGKPRWQILELAPA